jgi:hypothetical protein
VSAVFKQLKSRRLAIVLQLTETTKETDAQRMWEVHDVERNRGFRVTLGRPLLAGRTPSEDQIEAAIGLAVERALTTPPEKIGGTMYDVSVDVADLDAVR